MYDSRLKKITISSLLIVVALILKLFSTPIMLFGSRSLIVSFEDTILIANGILFGPFSAIVSGIVFDITGLIVKPPEVIHYGFMLNAILTGLIPSLVVRLNFDKKVVVNNILFLILFITSSVYLSSVASIGDYNLTPIFKTVIYLLTFISLGVYVIVYKNNNKFDNEFFSISSSYFVVILVSIFVNYLLTPIWIHQLYSVPISASILIRVFKTILLINIDALLLFIVTNKIQKILED